MVGFFVCVFFFSLIVTLKEKKNWTLRCSLVAFLIVVMKINFRTEKKNLIFFNWVKTTQMF